MSKREGNLNTYHTVLFLHFVSLFVGFGAAAVMGLSLFRLRAATTVADALPWSVVAGKTERAFPVAIVGLFITGGYMTSDVWTWSTGWIDVGIVALVFLAASGILIASRRAKELEHALNADGSGPLSPACRKLTCDPALWIVSFGNPGLVVGIVWNMTQKPGLLGAIVAAVIGLVAGAAIALPFAKVPAAEASMVPAA